MHSVRQMELCSFKVKKEDRNKQNLFIWTANGEKKKKKKSFNKLKVTAASCVGGRGEDWKLRKNQA